MPPTAAEHVIQPQEQVAELEDEARRNQLRHQNEMRARVTELEAEKEAVIKERDELITDRNKAIKTSVVLLWMIEARDDDDDAKLCYNCGVPCLSNDADNKQTVPSSTTAQTYVIAYDNIKECYTCSCPDYMYRRASKDELCKHITKLKSTGRLPIQPVK